MLVCNRSLLGVTELTLVVEIQALLSSCRPPLLELSHQLPLPVGLHDMAIYLPLWTVCVHGGTFFGRERYFQKMDN